MGTVRRTLVVLLMVGVAYAPLDTARAQEKKAQPHRAAPLPTAAAVLEKYRAAIGGAAALKKYTARTSTGRFELPAQGIAGPFEIAAAAPDRMRMRIELPGIGALQRGYDGKVGWAIDAAIGPRLLEGNELEEIRQTADFYYELHDPKDFSSMTVLERAPFEGRECYTLELVRKSGFKLVEYYDVTSGLMAGVRMSSSSAMGVVPNVVTALDGYKSFGGILSPTIARQRALGIESVLTIERIEYDNVPAGAVALPAEVEVLLK
jgi:hypothetical protein